jgi:hypothetical protein
VVHTGIFAWASRSVKNRFAVSAYQFSAFAARAA